MLVIVTAGHRNRTGGDPEEMKRTPRFARAYVTALRAAGLTVAYAQETLDVPPAQADMFDGTLGDVARWVVKTAESVPRGEPVVMMDLHLEGGVAARGVFVIVPDDPTKPTQPAKPEDDVWQNNKPSRDLAGAIAKEIAAATAMTMRTVKAPGVMSERQSGVGLGGKRLAMFGITARLRDRMPRMIIEHGNIRGDLAIIDDPLTPQRCAEAVVRVLQAQAPVAPRALLDASPPRAKKKRGKAVRKSKKKKVRRRG